MNIEQNNKNIKSHSTHKKIFLNHLTLPIFYLIIGNNSINKMRFGRISLRNEMIERLQLLSYLFCCDERVSLFIA